MSKTNDLTPLLCAAYSHERSAWCVFKRLTDTAMQLLWPCHNEGDAKELAKKMNEGAVVCRGSKTLGTACKKCIKCELTLYT
ncbi:hypothetical protein [uncultured Paraglaciecola sp.]|uniref:hypothetical protein n=1 Tax=uncultured Paraglaciecola sp. TaxID=1765024 RepID=UPI002610EEFD|nr:hypothetical protein [uncultured Paraglaciecola sp.]